MKTLGLIGGTSWLSTIEYYRLLNQQVNARLGGNQTARCLIHSFNYAEIVGLSGARDWDGVLEKMTGAAAGLRAAGAEGIVMCANTMHLIADRLQERLDVPLIHIADATARELQRLGHTKTALLGTRFTMEEDFFKDRLARYGIETVIPNEDEREVIHRSIFEELGKNVFRPETKAWFLGLIESLAGRGAEGVVLGCTEIPLIVSQADTPVPVVDTTAVHVGAAVEFALGPA